MGNRKQPFGYRMTLGEITILPEEAELVRFIFQGYSTGATLGELTKALCRQEIPYYAGRTWNKNMVSRILEDGRYIGEKGYPALIEPEQLRTAAKKRTARARPPQKTPAQKALRRLCGTPPSERVEKIVTDLLNELIRCPDRIQPAVSQVVGAACGKTREELTSALELQPIDEDNTRALLLQLAAEQYDLVLLDLNLPKVDGMQVLRTLRRQDLETCVLILSARSEIADKVEGLDAGANDYLSKPFHLAELEARVRSLTRRKFIQQDVCLCCGRLSFNTRSRVAAVDGQTLALTRKESGVLEYLLLHQGRPVSQEELIEHVWDGSVDSFSNSIRVHISALRKKLRAVLGYDPIRNRIGEGYEIGGEVQ